MGARGAAQAVAAISKSTETFVFLGLCGVMPKNVPRYSLIIPTFSAIAPSKKIKVKRAAVLMQQNFGKYNVFSGAHFSVKTLKEETPQLLEMLEKNDFLSIDLEYSFILKECPDVPAIMITTDNPIYGPKFSVIALAGLKMRGTFDNIARYIREIPHL